MSSRQKRREARRHGAMAAGTKSPEGLQRSSMNATRHGLTAKTLVLPNESLDEFNRFRKTYLDKFQPMDEVELDLLEDMVSAQWRLRRIRALETKSMAMQIDFQERELTDAFGTSDPDTAAAMAFTHMANESKTLHMYLRYETALRRAFGKALDTLLRLRQLTAKPTTSEELPNEAPELFDFPRQTAPKEAEGAETAAIGRQLHQMQPS
jgi:hypothetical protein